MLLRLVSRGLLTTLYACMYVLAPKYHACVASYRCILRVCSYSWSTLWLHSSAISAYTLLRLSILRLLSEALCVVYVLAPKYRMA